VNVPRVSPARVCAYAVVRRVFEQGAYADRAFHAEARGLDARERSFAMALAYGTVQRRDTLDHVAARLLDRPPAKLEPPVLAALRLGLMQLLLLGGVAPHAAVHESVELVKRDARSAGGLVNAVLRRAVRDGPGIIATLDDETPERAAVLHSVPRWLAELWWRELGGDGARALLACVNRPAEAAVRVNTLIATVDEVRSRLEVPCHPAPGCPDGLVLDAPLDVYSSELWLRGAIMPQSRASMAAARTLAPLPGERVLDLCAAPGAKTTALAALMGDRGRLVAVERHSGRAQALRATLQRMRVSCAAVEVTDAVRLGDPAAGSHAADAATYDRVLVDPPCSGLGTLQSRPDLRWRVTPVQIEQLAAQQALILRAGAAAVRRGGTLVYSACTISRAECDDVVERFLDENRAFRSVGPYLRLDPARDGTDGFFIARLARH